MGPLDFLPAIALVALVVILFVLAERSSRRQRGAGSLRRGREERNAAGRVLEKYFRW
jgi:hypothetical protein